MSFWRFSNVVPDASRTISVKIFHVFWSPEALGSFLGWSLMNFGNFIFSSKFLKKLTPTSTLNQLGIGRVPLYGGFEATGLSSKSWNIFEQSHFLKRIHRFPEKWQTPSKTLFFTKCSSRCHFLKSLRLAPPWRRITLQSTRICSTSHWLNERKALESPRRDTTCASMGKFEKIGPKSRSERCFLMIFRRFSTVVPEASRTISMQIFHVFWCPEALGSFLEWSWIDLGKFIFSWKSSKKKQKVDEVSYFTIPRINSFEQTHCDSKLK